MPQPRPPETDSARPGFRISNEHLVNAPIGFFSSSPEGRILWANTAMARIYGYDSPDEFVASITDLASQTFADLEDLKSFKNLLDRQGHAFDFWSRQVRRDGSLFWASLNAWTVVDQSGRVTVHQGSAADITEIKQAEEEQKARQAKLIESMCILVGGVAHYLNNLLQAMVGNIQFLLMNKHEYHSDTERLKSIDRSIERAGQLVRQLQLLSRKAESRKQPLDLNEKVKEASIILERSFSRLLDIKLNLGDRLWPIKADPVQIDQVMLNLGINAANAMSEGGELLIRTQNISLDQDFVRAHLGAKAGEHVLLAVSDTGPGMDKETLAQTFDPFCTSKDPRKGAGFGLSSVYGIVVGHGGFIHCDSKVGQGTSVNIYLPVLDEEAVIEPAPLRMRNASLFGTETILIVDDESDIRELTQEALQSCGYRVLCAAHGEEALAVYAQERESIRLVILDLVMPGLDGRQCLHELLRINPELLVLIATGYSPASQSQEILQAGAAGIIGKPFQFTDLLAKVREMLDA